MATNGKTAKPAGRGDQSQRLKDIPGFSLEVRQALAALDIVRADQLVALARAPGARGALARHLGLSEAALTEAEKAATSGATAETIKAPVLAGRRSLGALPPPPALRAMALSIPLSSTRAALPALPPSVNLVKKMSPIRNQGNRGTCVAFCLTSIHEYCDRADTADYSERFLYFAAKAVDGHPGDCGTTQQAASGVLESQGQCTEKIWPYNPTASCNDHGTPPASAATDARRHTLGLTALNPHDVIAIKAALAAGRPAGISIPVYNSWYQSPVTERTGRITLPIGGEQDVGGHCMCVVGYQDDGPTTVTATPGGGFFILRNSWSEQWGAECPFGRGYGTIPYAYIAAFNWESYALPAKQPKPKPKPKKHRRRKKSKGKNKKS
jgi:hypothetical protein